MSHRVDMTTVLSHHRPLFALARKGVPEVVVSGVSSYKEEGAQVRDESATHTMIVARSLLKPWQFLAAGVGGEEAFWALGLASHSGQAMHLEELKALAKAAHATEEDLYCPRSYAMDPRETWAMQSQKLGPTRLHHPCSGKHLVALAACHRHGYPTQGYYEMDHPLQKRFMSLIGQHLGERPLWMTDSCGMPTFATTVRAQLVLWERLATSKDPEMERLRRLWTRHGRLVGGHGRLDSDLIEVGNGQILAKEGADGLLAVAAMATDSGPAATVFIKLASGYNPTHLALALWATLSREPHLPPSLGPVLDYLKARLEKWIPQDQELIVQTGEGA